MHNIINNKKVTFWNDWKKTKWFYSPFCIIGPSLPYGLDSSAMAESSDGRGVLLFGGWSDENLKEKRILELRADANSWNILDKTLENGRYAHVVIPLQWFYFIVY